MKYIRFLYLFLIGIVLCLSFAFALMQTKWAKEKIANGIALLCSRSGVTVKVEHIEGRLPFTWHIERLILQSESNDTLELKDVKLRIAILPLLNKTLSLSYFNVSQANLSFSSPTTSSENPDLKEIKQAIAQWGDKLNIPYRIIVHRLRINSLLCENHTMKKSAHYFVSASGDLHKNWRQFRAELALIPRGYPDSSVHVELYGNQKLNEAALQTKVQLNSLEPFRVFYPFYYDEQLELSFFLRGDWTQWGAFFTEQQMVSPLLGHCYAQVLPMQGPQFFRIPWKLDAQFAIFDYNKLSLNLFQIDSDLLKIHAKGTIDADLEKSTAYVSFSLPDLSLFNKSDLNAILPSLSLSTLNGSAIAEASYARGHLNADIQIEELGLSKLNFEQLSLHLEAEHDQSLWEGNGHMEAQSKTLPALSSSFDIQWQRGTLLSLPNLSLEGPGLLLAGKIDIDMQNHFMSGGLYGHLDHFNRFAYLLNDNSIDGSVGIECQFSQEGKKQHLRCALLGKNFFFRDYEIGKFTLSASMDDLFTQPSGTCRLLAEKLHSPLFDINSLTFQTASSEEEKWPFSLHLESDQQEPFSITAQGSWKKEQSLLDVEMTDFSGEIFSYPFSLKYPVTFERSEQFCSLSPVNMSIGEGSLYSTCDLNTVHSTAQIDLQHFPLAMLSLFYPTRSFDGTLSLNGFFDATSDNIQGALNATLEELNLAHYNQKEPLTAKGSLQAHLDHNIVQTHAYLSANNEQFVECTATLPIDYTLYPFALVVDKQKNVSAELIAEGRVQDLFDFINMGSHRLCGYLSSRLFLSQTLTSPSLQGNIEWQEGSYENYITGTALNNIHAKLHAQNNHLDLVSFSATDDKKGTVTGEGHIDLNPQEHFPYAFIAEVNNMNAVHFNPIDCNLTGPLYISGTTREATAEGNLLVPQAEFKIPDKLPSEVPYLPVTFVNTPHSRHSKTLIPTPAFPFHINFEVTAEDNVIVTGKGLNSEWKGTLHLTGTNMNVSANGTLSLVKGEYSLFGKSFKLTEGQIVFNDKPSPSATINLSGNLSLAETIITAQLRGPLSTPILTFQSNPQMSTSAILAQILFNKNISDISQPEAIQLATTLISLSGGAGPSVLETIRKNIGVDRLTIASQTANPDEIAVQIGKYLTKGVLITLSQSATSSQVIVEVEFKHGFVFQAETQEEQEGKFTLKWTHSY